MIYNKHLFIFLIFCILNAFVIFYRRNLSRGACKEVNFEMTPFTTKQKPVPVIKINNEKLKLDKEESLKSKERIAMREEEDEGPYDWLSKMEQRSCKRSDFFLS